MRSILVASFVLVVVLVSTAWGAPPASAGGGCHSASGIERSPEAGSSLVVRMDGCTFTPAIDQVPVGTQVTFVNAGLTTHDATGQAGTWRSPLLDPGDSFRYRFVEAGVYPYSCSLHPGMAGVVIVGDQRPVAADAVAAPPAASPSEPAAVGTAQADVPVLMAAGGTALIAGSLLAAIALLRRRSRSRASMPPSVPAG